MLRWALAFLLVAGALELAGTAGAAAGLAKGLAFIAIVLFIATVIAGVAAGSSIMHKLSSKKARLEDHHLSHR